MIKTNKVSKKYNFINTVSAIINTPKGTERNMYPYLRDIFIYTLNHKPENIIVDTSISKGSIPDLTIKTDSAKFWAIVEVKDEKGIFNNNEEKEKIFRQKHKYIKTDTEYFVFIDPSFIVVRPVFIGKLPSEYDSSKDIVYKWSDFNNETEFKEKLSILSAENASLELKLEKFREGDLTLISSVSVDNNYGKTLFMDSLKKVVELLYSSFDKVIFSVVENVKKFYRKITEFENNYSPSEVFSSPVLSITSKGLNIDNKKFFKEFVSKLKEIYHLDKLSFKIANEYVKKHGNNLSDDDILKILKQLVYDTVNITLARIIFIRFLEDNDFFGNTKYICNGGIRAFQEIKRYFKSKYPALLKLVYEEAGKIYETVFGETILDWFLYSDDENLSRSIERVMYYLSFFNFTTIQEDILSEIYKEIIPSQIRKKFGQFYTPSSVARYIVKSVKISSDSKILDPACGLGTFLVESFQELIGEKIRRGIFNYNDVLNKIENIRGNDINSFVSTIAQIQILWHLLRFKDDIKNRGFPSLKISGGHDSLLLTNLFGFIDEWYEIDNDKYDAVVGNPPFVRPERQILKFGDKEKEFYREISHESNLFSLFIYKSMSYWLKEDGKLGFIVPLSFCDNEDNQKLRELFMINKKWKILEIVDFEEVSKLIFPDCAVNPTILIAENCPATKDDTVSVKIVTNECIEIDQNNNIINFDINSATVRSMPYADIWSDDGRILARITEERKRIIEKINQNKTCTFYDIARRYYVGLRGNKIVNHSKEIPSFSGSGLMWEERRMLCWGIAFRGKKSHDPTGKGLNVYKGENISPCVIEGKPVFENLDVKSVDSPELWRYIDILPSSAFAFALITLVPYGVQFNPKEICFLNTATIFIPEDNYIDFPFDFLVLSTIYQWYFAVYLRKGVMSHSFRAHLYPSVLGNFPFSEKLKTKESELKELKKNWINNCYTKSNKLKKLLSDLKEIKTETLEQRFDKNPALTIIWPNSTGEEKNNEEWYRIQFGEGLFDFFEINDLETAKQIEKILPIFKSMYDGVDDIIKILREINLPTPENVSEWNKKIDDWQKYDVDKDINSCIESLDQIVAECFSLTDEELNFIKEEMATDSLFSKLKYKLPYSIKRFRGLLSGLNESDRYKR